MSKIFLIAVVLLSLMGTQTYAMEKGEFQTPSLEGFLFNRQFKIDEDEDGIKESDVTIYKNPSGDQIGVISTGGIIWLWSRRDHDYLHNRTDINRNYSIRDSNCDAIFDERYATGEPFYLPNCLK
ncbi:MAG: hypothetical protein FJ139_06545 [Deltaproteobacteria bacterium]|nr:hypothetical protein [Deltaproteobacteria bacterium]